MRNTNRAWILGNFDLHLNPTILALYLWFKFIFFWMIWKFFNHDGFVIWIQKIRLVFESQIPFFFSSLFFKFFVRKHQNSSVLYSFWSICFVRASHYTLNLFFSRSTDFSKPLSFERCGICKNSKILNHKFFLLEGFVIWKILIKNFFSMDRFGFVIWISLFPKDS